MATRDLPEGIDGGNALRPPHRALARWWGRLVVGLLALICLLGLLNVFGQAMTTSRASGADGVLTVDAPASLRGGLLYQVVVRITAHQDIKNARLTFSAGWFSGVTTNAEVPQPSQQQSDDDHTVFTLGPVPAGRSRTVRISFQVNPTTVAWQRSQDVILADGDTVVATVRRTVNVLP
jgi:hypothetical protein